ncbi:ABC transporter permease [Paenibacillus macerans]|uniref:ABC transporter permease n=1 Tax=Paenibacillus macerans TaxID=44252 RepID=UPI00203EFB72|nr:ABC transporter permease [Paenibacillus macerans]MCM3701183.1 ABC transporter permease [Paenibacillus macerans]
MIRSIAAEWLKLRRGRIWITMTVLPALSLFIGCFNYYSNQAVLNNAWYSLWTQVSLFYGEFFFPILIAICCAYVCRLEHANRNWNLVHTAPVSAASIYFGKLTVIAALILGVQALFIALYLLFGLLLSLPPADIPVELAGWALRGWIAAISIASMQLLLSFRIRSFATPVGISICCSMLGLGLYILNMRFLFPFSLLTTGMGVLEQSSLTGGENGLFIFINAVYISVFSALAIHRLRTADVVTT